ncbi:MAG TPA: LysR family transcriptional regulator [Noviherbaspirillum sp.]|nr:LysR family transcriptional regulator [Noviherbaspirillum sp.]
MNMDIKALQFLVAVVDSGSMSAAAKRLGSTRSSVSRRLKALEQTMRVQLLRRTTRRLELTHIGWALYEHAVKITQEMAALQATVEDMGRSLRGHLRVSVPVGLGQMMLGPLLLEFCERYPEVTLQLTFSNRVFDLLAEEIDVAVRVAATPPDSYVARELAKVDWILCVSPTYLAQHGAPANPAQLSRYSVVMPPVRNNRLVLQLSDGTRNHSVELIPRLQCADLQFLKRAILAASGYGVLPHYLIRDELADGRLLQALPGYKPDTELWGDKLYLITAPNLYPTLAIRTLVEFLRAQFAEGGSAHELLAKPEIVTAAAQ